jgi:glycosyltransferase involved in cell wall biosynthesis
MKKPHISLVMMLKNEEKRLEISLYSVLGVISSLIIYDTGSTDSTVSILKKFSNDNNIPLYLMEGEFEDFSTSRNRLLDFADSIQDVDFLLLLDCNDQLRNGKNLIEFATKNLNNNNESAWMTMQEWFSGITQKYYNVRFLRPKNNWRYVGVVHEYLTQYGNDKTFKNLNKIEEVIIYQDRTADDDKSYRRFSRDRELLLNELQKNPKNARTVFYLAQTCQCLNLLEEAYKYYEMRTGMGDFYEEVYLSYHNCGMLSELLNYDWNISLKWYMKSQDIIQRAESLVKIANYYRDKNWMFSYHFAKMACELPLPQNVTLWIDMDIYEYERYHILGIAAYYYKKYDEGMKACEIAIKAKNKQIDIDNLSFYNLILKPEQTKKILRRKKRK